MEHEAISIGDWYYIKLIMMSLFIFGDLFVNSKAEFEALEVDKRLLPSYYEATNNDSMGQLQIILFGCNILLQASIFSAFFLILVDTFPFQVGLIGVIWRQFKSMIIGQGCYSAISIIVGTMRLDQVFKGNSDIIWSNVFYVCTSFVHKLVAPCYYAISLRSALILGDEMYYTKDAWISSGNMLTDVEV